MSKTKGMIETNIPEITTDELMARIREEVARRRAANPSSPPPPLPHTGIPAASVDWHQINTSLHLAEQAAQVGVIIPGWARLGCVRRRLAQLTARVILYLSSFITNQQKQFNVAVLTLIRVTGQGLRNLENGVMQREERLSGLEQTVISLREATSASEQRLVGGLAQREERLSALEQTIGNLQNLKEQLGQEGRLIRELERVFLQLKTNLVLQEQRLGVLLEEARKRLPEPFDQQQLQMLADEGKYRLDALYVSFEDQFRGTREDIKERLKAYLPLMKEAGIGSETRPILDVGCGRGEWLELLQEEGLQAQGVDINRIMIEQCRQRGFEVVEDDVITYLRSLPDACLGAVTGLHLLEHLPFSMVIALLDETVRVLKPGGMAIFETPNPQNVLVGSCNFYMDPTHRNPLPSPVMKFLAEARGLCRVKVLNLHPFPETLRVDGSELAERFNEYFYGPQDYAVMGWKV